MKIGLQTCGSTGDIYPVFALAEGLANAGHEVTLYYTAFFGQLFSPKKVHNLMCSSTAIFDPQHNYTVPSRPIFTLDAKTQMDYVIHDIIQPFALQMEKAAEDLCRNNDMVIGVATLYQLICMAEKYKVPFISYQVDNAYVPSINNEKIWLDQWIDDNWLPIVNPYREQLGLQPRVNLRQSFYRSSVLNLLTFSSLLETKQHHWGETFEVCGYFHHQKNDAVIDQELQAFIDAGTPPVFISVGSMMFYEMDADPFFNMIITAVKHAGVRAIIQTSHNNKYHGPFDNTIYGVAYVEHDAVLSQCLGMVHHGGSGTVHTALRNGCPSITIAYAFDQFLWGQKLVGLGASPSLLFRNRVDDIQLAGDLRKLMCYPHYKEAADFLRRKMKREDGVKKAVRCIERLGKTMINVIN